MRKTFPRRRTPTGRERRTCWARWPVPPGVPARPSGRTSGGDRGEKGRSGGGPMRILIAGNGGREHALLWKLRRDAPSASFFATLPNGGMAPLCTGVGISPADVVALAGWAAASRIDLVVVGPETPLAAGLADRLRRVGIPVFGPSAAAARIESSKAFAKDLMAGAGVPTAAYEVHTNGDAAEAHIEAMGTPIVVKASGLAAGKGAVVCRTVADAVATARDM
ncbi:MAG: hypothetical protein F4107_07930, partial [Gemmatimonadetes bacterium]|nr:hypothetical protein [Gemmatimonadota bacterium]